MKKKLQLDAKSIDDKVTKALNKKKVTKKTTTPKKKVAKPTAKNKKLDVINKAAVTKQVITNRELKYIYPEGLTDATAEGRSDRKKFRQKVRNTIRRMEKQLAPLTEPKAKKALEGKLLKFRKQSLYNPKESV